MIEALKQIPALVFEVISLYIYMLYIYIAKFIRVFRPQPLKSLDGEVILITGAGSGIGRQLALHFARTAPNAKFVLWDIEAKPNESTVAAILGAARQVEAYAYQVDVSSRETVTRTAERVRREVGQVTIIVNNAGVCWSGPFLLQKPESLEKTFGVNMLAHCWTLREFLPHMIRTNHGHIVTVASLSSVLPANDFACYSASKHAVHGFVDALKRELRAHPAGRRKLDGIQFTTVYPVWVQTPLLKGTLIFRPRFPILFPPTLTPEYVAQKTVEGVRRNEEYVFLPPVVKFFALVLALLPFEIQQKLFTGLLRCEFEHPRLDRNMVRQYYQDFGTAATERLSDTKTK